MAGLFQRVKSALSLDQRQLHVPEHASLTMAGTVWPQAIWAARQRRSPAAGEPRRAPPAPGHAGGCNRPCVQMDSANRPAPPRLDGVAGTGARGLGPISLTGTWSMPALGAPQGAGVHCQESASGPEPSRSSRFVTRASSSIRPSRPTRRQRLVGQRAWRGEHR